MSAHEQASRKSNNSKGFAGLSSMVSDVKPPQPTVDTPREAKPKAASTEAKGESGTTQRTDGASTGLYQSNQPVDTGWWKAPAAIAVVLAVLWVLAHSDDSSNVRPTEERPPVGRYQVLTGAQLRWCAAESIRITAQETIVNQYDDDAVNRFNYYVEDYNSRCGNFRYSGRSWTNAQAEIDKYRYVIEAEGRAR